MNRRALAYIGIVIFMAILIIAGLPLDQLFSLSSTEAGGVLAFVAIGILSEAMAIDFGSSKQGRSSLAYIPFLASIFLFDLAVAVVAIAIVLLVSNFALRRLELAKGLFNISQIILAATGAHVTYRVIVTHVPMREIEYLAFVALAFAFFALNTLLASGALALLRQQPFGSMLRQVVGPGGTNIRYDLLASPISAVAALLYTGYGVPGVAMILLPLLLIRHSYLSKLQLVEANQDLLTVLIKAIETRDPYTSGHSVRVKTLASAIAKDLGLSAARLEMVEMAALLHDIGKVDSIYANVLRKPYELNDEERELIRTHASKGADLLESLSSVPQEVIKSVRHHHEKYDGTGYPSGLAGTAIPVAARIIMLCDSIDAMLSDRPYRSALPADRVRAELKRFAGIQFDPEIVAVVLRHDTVERARLLIRVAENSQTTTLAVLTG